MSHSIDRRRFLAGCTAASAAMLGSGLNARLGAIEPITRSGPASFKFSLAAYSYRGLLSGNSPKLKLSDFIRDCALFGVDGTELTSYYFPAEVTEEYLEDIKGQCGRLQLEISGTAVRNDFGQTDDEARQKDIDWVKQWSVYAAAMGAPVIRIFAGHVKQGTDPAVAHKLMVQSMEECCEYSGKLGVKLALENHGGPTATPAGLLALVRDVKSPWFGVNLDTGNFHTEDPYGDMAKAAPYAINVQVKVVTSGPDKKKTPTDYGRIAKLLRDAGYQGYVVLEYEETGDPREECPKHLDQLREAFKQ